MRGTFANIRIRNLLVDREGGYTRHLPSGEEMSVYDAAMQYDQENRSLVVVAGKLYGAGSSRDWAAKGTFLLGVKAVIAESFERIHRSNLVEMGVLPVTVTKTDGSSSEFKALCRIDSAIEVDYVLHGGILQYVLRQVMAEK
jgi:aconitate hydratase